MVGAGAGDAITTSALRLRAALRRRGASEIFAHHIDPGVAGEVRPLSAFAQRQGARADDVIVLHVSIGDPAVTAFLDSSPERVVAVYHNISPSEPFKPFDPTFAALLADGRTSLSALRSRVIATLATSVFNARELEALGFTDVRTVPPLVDPRRLVDLTPDVATSHHLATELDGPVVLYVGQLLPHQRQELLIAAYHALVTYHRPDARLVLVGAGRIPRYRHVLQTYIQELHLDGAWLTGAVTDAQLAAFYRRADVFVSASEHEGFGIPLLEAMAFDVPVVARAAAAVPETVGDAALLVPADDSVLVLAEAMAAMLDRASLRAGFVSAGRRRLAQLDIGEQETDMVDALEAIA